MAIRRKLKFSRFLLLFSLSVVLALLLTIGALYDYRVKSFIQDKMDHIQSIKVSQIQFDASRSLNDAFDVMEHLRIDERLLAYLRLLEEGGADAVTMARTAGDLETLLFNLKKDNPFFGSLLIQTGSTQYSSDRLYSANLPLRAYKPGEPAVLFVNAGETYRFFDPAPDEIADPRLHEALDRANATPYLWSRLADETRPEAGSLLLKLDGAFFREHIPYGDNMVLLDRTNAPIFVGRHIDGSKLAHYAELPEGDYREGQIGATTSSVTVRRLAPYGFTLVYEENVSVQRKQASLMVKLLLLTLAASALLSVLVAPLVSGALLRPILRFLRQMRHYDTLGDRLVKPAEKPALSLHARLFLYFAVTILLPVVFFIAGFYVQSRHMVGEELRASYATLFDNTAHRIEQFIDQKSVGLARISYDPFIRRLLTDGADDQDADISRWIRQNEYLGISRDTISIYDSGSRLVYSNFYPLQNTSERTLASMQRSSSGLEYDLVADRSGASYIRLGMDVYNSSPSLPPSGMIRLDVNSLFLSALYADFKENNSSAYIVDEAGTIVSHSDAGRIGDKDDVRTDDEKYRFQAKLQHVPWYFVSEFDGAAVREQTLALIYDDISIVLALLLLALLFAYLMTRYLVHPFRRLGLAGLEEAQPEQRSVRTYGIEEVDQLSQTYNRMLDRIETLVDESLIAGRRQLRLEFEKRESLLFALQAQINPHFLYNTLESLLYTVEKRDNDKAAEMIHLLSGLFRYMMGHDRPIVPLREEMACVQAYVRLMEQRHGDHLACRWTMDEELRECGIVRLVLQPVLENVFQHGMPHTSVGVTIEVDVRRSGDRIVIEVSDNGSGMSEDRLHEVRSKLGETGGDGIGIYNVNKRLKLYYGDDYGLAIDSRLGSGTRVTMTIPYSPGANM
ncbi:sensor histidine kinase [Paenibacillus cymbidii]|uniref:sensor histidine kinase n=1 Tax=Paenibacillus cymbidii TaxID=1639034 RepID=UPI00108012C1|nr:sensor histidine kinase [Paenibacillus cymbidii]